MSRESQITSYVNVGLPLDVVNVSIGFPYWVLYLRVQSTTRLPPQPLSFLFTYDLINMVRVSL